MERKTATADAPRNTNGFRVQTEPAEESFVPNQSEKKRVRNRVMTETDETAFLKNQQSKRGGKGHCKTQTMPAKNQL